MGSGRRALLGRLAGLGWFARHGEPAATQALAMLLEDGVLRDAIVGRLSEVTGTDLSDVRSFEAEAVQGDQGRPDLRGVDSGGRPVVVVEAKFSALLGSGQVGSYLVDQAQRLGPDASGALLLLVPETRAVEAETVLEAARAETAAGGRLDRIATGVVTWDEWLDVWESAVGTSAAAGFDLLRCDVAQLRELCLTLGGLVIPPLGAAATGVGWREREQDLAVIVDQITRQLPEPGMRTFPIVHEDGYDPLRYAPGGYAQEGSFLSVGLASRFAAAGVSPLWVRWHKGTPHFPTIRERLRRSAYHAVARDADGHLWLPLSLPPDLAGPALVEQAVSQVRQMQAVLASPEVDDR